MGRLAWALISGVLVTVATAPSVAAQDEPQLTFLTPRNAETCTLTVNGDPERCERVVNMLVPATGRQNFHVMHGEGATAFSGGEDSQPSLNRHVLVVDSLLERIDGRTVRRPAAGRCDTYISDDGRVVYRLSCEARSARQVVRLEFAGTAALD